MRIYLRAIAFGLLLIPTSNVTASDYQLFRIGTGGPKGTYYPVGTLLSKAVSDLPGCAGEECGAAGILAVPQASNGSIANVEGIVAGTLEGGLVQSDIAHWAYTGTGVYDGEPGTVDLRAITRLYSESMHIVARRGAGIRTLADLKDKKVSLDEPGSGTLVDASLLLASHGFREGDLDIEYVKPGIAIEKLLAGDLDAFFIVAGYPVRAVAELAAAGEVNLVPIDSADRDRLLSKADFFSEDLIPEETYTGIPETKTVGVGALLVTSASQSADTVYKLTKALWRDHAKNILESGHTKGKEIVRKDALEGISIPLHPGALTFYKEIGMEIDE